MIDCYQPAHVVSVLAVWTMGSQDECPVRLKYIRVNIIFCQLDSADEILLNELVLTKIWKVTVVLRCVVTIMVIFANIDT